MKKTKKKLVINRETVRRLGKDELSKVDGGWWTAYTLCDCYTNECKAWDLSEKKGCRQGAGGAGGYN